MKCNYCQAEWTVNSAMSASIKSCPFCGKPIAMAPDDKLGSMVGALKAIIAHSGIDGLRDGKRALAMFSDLAPQLRREKIMFSYFVQCDGNVVLLDAINKPRSEQIVCRGKVAQQMMRDILVNEDVAYEACDAFWEAIGGTPLKEVPFEAKTVSPQPATTAKGTNPAPEKPDSKPVFVPTPSKPVSALVPIPSPAKPKPTTPGIPSKPTVVLSEKKRTPAELYQEGLKFEKGYAAPKNLALAIQLYTDAAKQGDPDAMFSLGEIYSAGTGVDQDLDEAFLWYQRAAEKGHVRAILQLGICNKEGLGTRKNAVEALRWIRTAAAKGDKKAQYMLSTSSDLVAPGQKASNYEQAAKAGNPDAQYNYAKCYATASGGVTRNYTLAADYYERAAKQGHSRAQFAIAEMYEKGQGVMVSLSKAEEYYRLAAQSNDTDIARQATAALRHFQKQAPIPTPTKKEEPTSWFKKMFGRG